MRIDLHTHSKASDGKLTPKELIDSAIKRKIKAIAITDHDSIGGLEEAIAYSLGKKIELVPGIEFSADPEELAKEIHLVGLYIDPANSELRRLIERQKVFGIANSRKIIRRLNELGYEITFEEVSSEARTQNFGRPHIAQVLMRKYAEFKDRKQVFNELLGKEGKAFFKNKSSSMNEIIRVIHQAGGIAILAHPGYLYDNAERVTQDFVKLGGDGLEVECAYDSLGKEAQKLRYRFRRIAKQYNLIISGGTDFHGEKDNFTIGSFGLTALEFRKLKEYVKNRSPHSL